MTSQRIRGGTEDVGRTWPQIDRRKPGWAADWQSTVEQDKATLAETLHDDTGGLLVAAVMDISWAERRLGTQSPEVKDRLKRARAALDVAIDLNRRMIEDLRPTLLENFGLVAALKWHFSETCKTAHVDCEQHLAENGRAFSAPAAIALYRIAQTLIATMVIRKAHTLKMSLSEDGHLVTLELCGKGAPESFTREDEMFGSALASAAGRAKALGGDIEFAPAPGGASITCHLPASTALV